MRLTFLLVVAMATLSASCSASSVATGLKITSTRNDAVLEDEQRLLRRRDDEENEERAGGNLGKVDDAADEFSFMITMFKEWDDIPFSKIATSVYLDKASPDQFAAMLVMYKQYQKIGAEKLLEKLRAGTSK